MSLPPLRGYQSQLLLSTARIDLTVSAPQIGKSFALGMWLLSSAWQDAGRSGCPWWLCAPTYEAVKDRYLRYIVQPAESAGILASHTESVPLRAKLINGSVLEARSWEEPKGLWGSTPAGIAPDEFGFLTVPAWTAMRSRVSEMATRGLGFIRGVGNVTEIGGIAEKLYRLGESGAPGYASRTWTWRDRALAAVCACGVPNEIDRAADHGETCERGLYLRELAAARSEMSPAHFRQLYEAEWVDWSALPVYTFERAVHVTTEAERQDDLPVDISCDFNVDPLCWVLGQHHGEQAWDFDEIVIPGGATTLQACQEFMRRNPDSKHTVVEVYGDRSGKSRSPQSRQTDYEIIRHELETAGYRVSFHVPEANPAVTARVNAVNSRLLSGDGRVRYRVHPRCETLINDRIRVSWRPGTTEIDKRDRTRTHASDASDYRLARLYPVRGQGQSFVGVPSAVAAANAPLVSAPDFMVERF